MLLKFYIDRYGDQKAHFEFVWVKCGTFDKSYLQEFLEIPGSFIDFVCCYTDTGLDLSGQPVIWFDPEAAEMFYV